MRQISVRLGETIQLGKQGENLARTILFPQSLIADWMSYYGDGTVQLIHKRPSDAEPYPCAIEQDGTSVSWQIRAADVAFVGAGHAELQYYVNNVVAKSMTWTTFTQAAMEEPGAPVPAPQESFLEQVLQAATDAQNAAEAAEDALDKAPIISSATGNWEIWDAALGAYVDTGHYAGGTTPYIGANGNWYVGSEDTGVSATGPQGPVGPAGPQGVQGVQGPIGPQGPQGNPGATGPQGPQGEVGATGPAGPQGETGPTGGYYTPSITQINAYTAQFSFTASDGDMPSVSPAFVTLPAGPQGEVGEVGPAGPQGPAGPAYVLTAEDKQEIVDDVLANFPTYNGEVESV